MSSRIAGAVGVGALLLALAGGGVQSTPPELPAGAQGPFAAGSRVPMCGDTLGISSVSDAEADDRYAVITAHAAGRPGTSDGRLRNGDEFVSATDCLVRIVAFGSMSTNVGAVPGVYLLPVESPAA